MIRTLSRVPSREHRNGGVHASFVPLERAGEERKERRNNAERRKQRDSSLFSSSSVASFLSPSSDPRLFFLARCETIACEYLDRSRRSAGKSPAAPFLLFALRVGRLPIPSPIQNSAQISPSILPDRARLPKIAFPFHPCRVAFPAMKIIARSLIILLPPSRPFFRPPEVFHPTIALQHAPPTFHRGSSSIRHATRALVPSVVRLRATHR